MAAFAYFGFGLRNLVDLLRGVFTTASIDSLSSSLLSYTPVCQGFWAVPSFTSWSPFAASISEISLI
ncbi:UNVERIFIED_CONTAM: hypothetical protein Sradi_5086300 [Sesamum radiatum]|uniref:Uncharacterized protein n=1 Tax=Sesamum radiatum TaxID=300843 RepID=A0AAW2M124_SESRA